MSFLSEVAHPPPRAQHGAWSLPPRNKWALPGFGPGKPSPPPPRPSEAGLGRVSPPSAKRHREHVAVE